MSYAIHTAVPLYDAVEADFRLAANHRAARDVIFKAYIGDSHGLSNVGSPRTPLNGHALYVRSLLLYLAAHQPNLLITTNVGPWKKYMEGIRSQCSRVMKQQRFGSKQQRWVIDAMVYSPGLLKVAQEWRTVPIGDEGDVTTVLQTLVANVDGNDYVYSMGADAWWNADYEGHKIRHNVDQIINNPMFRKVNQEDLLGLSGWSTNDNDRLFFEQGSYSQPYKKKVTCWEIYDRCTGNLKIWPVDNPNMVLYDEPWEGHDNGPLHKLDFLDVPNHPVGMSPLCIVHSLIEAMNRALSKTIKQTDVAKNIFRSTGGNPAEAEALMTSMDGWGLWLESGGAAEVVNIPGPDKSTMAAVPFLRELFNWEAGNINELAGLGVSAPTATQGQLLSQAASGMVKFMQARTQESVRQAVEAIVQNEIKDQVNTEVSPLELADGSTYWKKFTPEMRQALNAVLLNIDIDVFSMRYRAPEERLQQLMQWWTGFVVPGFPIAQQQGLDFDMGMVNRIYASYSDMPEINDVTTYTMGPTAESSGQDNPVPLKQSPVTTRTNIRADSPKQETFGGEGMMKMMGGLDEAA